MSINGIFDNYGPSVEIRYDSVGDLQYYQTGPVEWIDHESKIIESETVKDMRNRISAIEQRLAILNHDAELCEQFPALKEAYDHYKTIEALVSGKNKK